LRKHYANLFFLSGEGEAGLFAIATREYFLLFCHPDLNHANFPREDGSSNHRIEGNPRVTEQLYWLLI
jgi:hypothetical protein